jgi:hypothetical protein
MTDTAAPPAPSPHPRAPEPITGLHTNVETVLRLVLGRLDAQRATVPSVRAALAAAGVMASHEWCASWLAQVRAEISEHTTERNER